MSITWTERSAPPTTSWTERSSPPSTVWRTQRSYFRKDTDGLFFTVVRQNHGHIPVKQSDGFYEMEESNGTSRLIQTSEFFYQLGGLGNVSNG